jgi:hypothetical protein
MRMTSLLDPNLEPGLHLELYETDAVATAPPKNSVLAKSRG